MNMNRLQSLMFKLLLMSLLAILAWQSQIHFISVDLTKSQRNSLSNDSVELVKQFDKPLSFKLFSSPSNEQTVLMNDLLKRYQYHQPLLSIEVINPDLAPDLLRQYDIRQDGVLIIEYQQKTESLTALTERNISSALQRLLRHDERWIVFLEGHGERHPYGDANHDMSTFSAQLANKGFIVESVNLSQSASIPNNTSVLVIASAQTNFLPGEVEIISRYIQQGGHLLWLTEPDKDASLEPLAELFNIERLPGVVVDPNTQLLGLNRVDYALISEYPFHPITEFTTTVSIFPQAVALYHNPQQKNPLSWQATTILETQTQAWNEVGPMQGEILLGDQSDESAGPLTLGIAFQRNNSNDETNTLLQRAIIIGDGDFLANQFLGNGANAELGYNIINWLSHDDNLVAISAKPAPDTQLILSDAEKIILTVSFLILLPAILLLIGLRILLTRKKR